MKLGMILLLLSSLAFANENPQYSKNRLIVKIKDGQKLPIFKNAISSKKLFGNVYVVRTNSVESLEAELKNNSAIAYTEKDYKAGKRELAKLGDIPIMSKEIQEASPFNDPKVGRIWSFNSAIRNGVSVNDAYRNREAAETQVIVAVVDTGVDYNHEDLKDVMWVNEGEIPGNGIDDDNNGYIDDVHGINTLNRDSDGNATGDMMDTHSHGTHVSGTIGAKQNNNIGIAGIASNVRIMGLRTVPNSGDETDVDVIESFIYAAEHGARIINCSFGKAHNEGGMAVSEAIEFIGQEYGTLVVAAAGNSSQDIDRRLTYPASFTNENLLVIASTQKYGSLSYFSNYGLKNVDLAAPGSSIYSTVPGGYSSMSGTSMAAPTTVGVAAEVLSRFPDLTVVQLKQVLMDTVTKKSRFSSKMVSGGRVDLKAALEGAELL